MKAIIKNLALLAVLAIVFSNLSGCGGSTSETGNENSAAANSSGNAGGNSDYPMLNSSIANADIELIDGTTTKIADRKGQVLLLNLWGIWCIPCRAEMPHLVAMQDKHRDQNFRVLGLNVGDDFSEPEDVEKIKKFAGEMNLNYELARIPETLTNEFFRVARGQAVPTTLLVDRDGRLRGVFVGGSERVIKAMEENVAKVVAGESTGNVAKEGLLNEPLETEGNRSADANKN